MIILSILNLIVLCLILFNASRMLSTYLIYRRLGVSFKDHFKKKYVKLTWILQIVTIAMFIASLFNLWQYSQSLGSSL